MIRCSINPNSFTLSSVLQACSNLAMLEIGKQIHALTMKKGFYDDKYAGTALIKMYGKCGSTDMARISRRRRFEEAATLIEEVRNPDVVLWRTLLSACRNHGEVEMAERVTRKVLELAPGDEGTHILLSNLYASAGKWKQVIQMKSTIRDLKVKKNPAMSWVDVDREVHTFMAGDFSHPRAHEICEMLLEVTEKVKTLGYNPDTKFVLQDIEEEKKITSLYYHSEKLAIAFTLWKTNGRTRGSIRIFKNLRVCGDCHNWIKFVSLLTGREIIARDAKRFHHFKGGICSCGDYW
ncbi:hypothetical protein K1719_017173 [Acacia pycnantha]|nr:hypothetical protein K1719_017173 [Acacia pycnantha]